MGDGVNALISSDVTENHENIHAIRPGYNPRVWGIETFENPVVVVGHDMKSEDKCKTPHFPKG